MAQLRQLVIDLKNDYGVSERKACGVVMVARSTIHYEVKKREDRAVRKRIREIAETRVRYGFWRIHVLLRREGWKDNHKRTYRIYREEGLNLRSKRQGVIKQQHTGWSGLVLMEYINAARWILYVTSFLMAGNSGS